MARRIYSEDLVLNLIINGKDMPAQNKVALNELYKLDRQTRELEIALAKVEVAQRKLGKETAANSAQFKKLEKDAQSLKIKIGQNNATMNKLRESIGRTGLTINQLNSYLKVLKIQLNNATDPRIMARLRKEIILTENRVKHLVTGASRLSIAFERLGTVANKFGTVTSWIAIVAYAFGRAVGGTVNTLRELDKTFSNVMKSTGLTRQEMWALKQQFDQLNINESMKTPTATKDLLEISRIAGRLGVRGVQNIADFTMAVDKLYVALGEDLQGSVEEVAEKVGKLVTTFGLTPELPLGEAMLRAGSLINQLAKSSAAGAETILNYTSRLGGVGSMAKFSMDQLAGLGAALDAVGVPAERGSTALAKLITGMGEHAEQFAMALGMSTEEYRNAMETNINETMLKLIQSSAQGNASIMDVVAGMDKMDVSGVRVMEVYGKLVQKMDLVIEQQAIAKAAFSSSASVMNEFYIMSKDFNSLMAIQGKRWKALSDDYAKAVAPSVYKMYRAFTDLAYAMRDGVKWIAENIRYFIAFIGVLTALKSVNIIQLFVSAGMAIKTFAVEQWAATKATIANNAAVKSMRIAYYMAGGGVKGLGAAFKDLWKIMLNNPFTSIIAIVSIAVSALVLFKKRADDVTKAIDEMNAAVAEQTGAMKVMFDALNKTNEETKERKQLIDDLNMMYGEYLTKLITETDTVKELADAYTYASLQMEKKIRLEAQQTKVSELSKPYEEKMSKKLGNMISELDEVSEEKMGKKINNFDRGYLSRTFGAMFDEMAEMEQYPRYVTDEMITRLNSFISSFITDFDGIKRGNNQLYLYLQQAYAQRVEIEDLKRKFLLEGKGTEKAIEEQIAKIDVGFTPVISQSEYEDQVEVAKQNSEKLILLKKVEAREMNKTDDWLKKEELKAEQQHIEALIEIEKKRFTATKELTDKEFRELQNKYGSLEEMEKNEPGIFWMGGGAGYGKKKELSGMDAALVPLQQQLEDNIRQQKGEGKSGGGPKTKIEKDKEIKFVDIAKLRAESLREGKEKDVAEENVRYANALGNYKLTEDEKVAYAKKSADEKAAIDKNRNDAAEIEEQIHNTKLNEIHLTYLDKQLADDNVTYAQKILLLEAELKDQLITHEEYEKRKKEITNNYEENILAYKKKYGVLVEDTLEREIAMFEKSEFYALLSEEEKQKGIESIRKKYEDKRERTFKTNIEAEFDSIKEGFDDLQMQALAQGESMLSVWQNVGQGIGDAFTQLFDNSQKGFSAFAKQMVLMAIDLAAQMARAQYPIILAKNIAKYALVPGGQAIALAKTAQSIILIEAAFGIAKAAVSSLWKTEKKEKQYAKGNYPVDRLRQFAGGKFPVMGKDDGRTYDAEYVGQVKTGVYKKPSLGLFAERPEMVIDYPTLRNIQMNNPKLIEAILAHRVVNGSKQQPAGTDGGARQFAKGNYPVTTTGLVDNELKELIMKNIAVNEKLLKWRPTVYSEMIKKDLDTLSNIERNRKL